MPRPRLERYFRLELWNLWNWERNVGRHFKFQHQTFDLNRTGAALRGQKWERHARGK